MPPKLTDQIRKAMIRHVKRTGESYYAIAQACSVRPAQLYLFRDGGLPLSLSSLDRLAGYLGLSIQSPPRAP